MMTTQRYRPAMPLAAKIAATMAVVAVAEVIFAAESEVGGAIGVWLALNGGKQTVATIATVFNLPPAMIREAVEADYWLFLSPEEGADDDATFVESEGL